MTSLIARRASRAALTLTLVLGSAMALADGEIDYQAKAWASACVTCHGAAQPVPGSVVAPLAGMPAADLVSKMTAFAEGNTPGSLMEQVARGYDRETLERIGRWYEKQGKAQ
ncbi:MAG TPA: hypothetical protein VK062_06625 [Burkholderiaceae bacterium]|nr:hypothetical protein [Burkholderiaceae bacterium]